MLNHLREVLSCSLVCEKCSKFKSIVGIVGDSGSGKSLLLNFLAKRDIHSSFDSQMNLELRVHLNLRNVKGFESGLYGSRRSKVYNFVSLLL